MPHRASKYKSILNTRYLYRFGARKPYVGTCTGISEILIFRRTPVWGVNYILFYGVSGLKLLTYYAFGN